MQRFCQLAHGVVNNSDDKIIAAFITRVHGNRCREELGIHEPSTVSELYALVDECARAEQVWLAQNVRLRVTSKKKKGTRKRASKQVLAVEPRSSASIDKNVMPDVPMVTAATLTQGIWCPIHETNSHDLKNCHLIYDLAENRRSAPTTAIVWLYTDTGGYTP
jgi:hypothetical protein